MQRITLQSLMENPEEIINAVTSGQYYKVGMEDGSAVVMIDECEWAMLRQALNICMEHPEWTEKSN